MGWDLDMERGQAIIFIPDTMGRIRQCRMPTLRSSSQDRVPDFGSHTFRSSSASVLVIVARYDRILSTTRTISLERELSKGGEGGA